MNRALELSPKVDMERYDSEREYGFRPYDLCKGHRYIARMKLGIFATKRYAADVLVVITSIDDSPSALSSRLHQRHVNVGMLPVYPDGKPLDDPVSRAVLESGLITYSDRLHALRRWLNAEEGYFVSASDPDSFDWGNRDRVLTPEDESLLVV